MPRARSGIRCASRAFLSPRPGDEYRVLHPSSALVRTDLHSDGVFRLSMICSNSNAVRHTCSRPRKLRPADTRRKGGTSPRVEHPCVARASCPARHEQNATAARRLRRPCGNTVAHRTMTASHAQRCESSVQRTPPHLGEWTPSADRSSPLYVF